jgi:hypothetical protein
MNIATALLIAATVTSAMACGATFDQTFKQLPARHRIGASAYAAYARAADLSNGLIWYPIVGISTTLLCAAAAVAGLLDHPNAMRTTALVILAVGTVVFTAATSRAAPTLLTLRHSEVTDAQAQTTLNRFARFNAIRAIGIAVTVLAAAWALILAIG